MNAKDWLGSPKALEIVAFRCMDLIKNEHLKMYVDLILYIE